MAKPLELLLNNGRSLVTGEQISDDRGGLAVYSDFDSFYKAYLSELAKWIGVSVEVHNRLEETFKEDTPMPFMSATVSDCIQKARDYSDGGPRYNPSYIQATGISTVVDSLVILRDLVFGSGEVSAERMLEALKTSFENDADLLAMVKNHPAKYGNDIDDVDSLFVDISSFFYNEVKQRHNTRGGRYYPGYMVFLSHEWLGANTGAMPDGRLARAALSDSVGSVQGMDSKGITALFKSATKNDYLPAVGGVTFNVRLMPSFFDEEETIDKLVSAVRVYFALGGMQMQVNVVDSKILREAQKRPDDFKDLMVRVGGFSAYFTGLAASLQEEIIKRTEHVG
jgi:formate C-acetyltransferase